MESGPELSNQLLSLMGCAETTPSISQKIHFKPMPFSVPQRIEDLAGPWEYKDEAGQGIITLNAEGKGTYEWEKGWFETHSFKKPRLDRSLDSRGK